MTDILFDPSRIRAVAFDGYGTLFDFEMTHFRVEVDRLLIEQRAEVDHDAFFETWQKSYRVADVWDHTTRTDQTPAGWPTEEALNGPLPPWHSQWEIWRRQFQAALDAHAVPGDATLAANRFREALSVARAYPEAHDTVDGLAARGLLMALLSNADEDFLQGALSRARLRFSIIQSSESLRAYKPHRAIFAALCERASCGPSEILYVGDSPFADVAGARNAGLRTAWVHRTDHPYPAHLPRPDVQIATLDELLAILPGASATAPRNEA